MIELETSRFQIQVTPVGFGLILRRGGETVLQSAQAADPLPNLSFEHQGRHQRVTDLRAQATLPDGVRLTYDTTVPGVQALVDLQLAPDSVRVTVRLQLPGCNLAPSARHRLDGSGLWYGGGFQGSRAVQVLPLNDARINEAAFLAQAKSQATPVWYATKGVAIRLLCRRDFRYSTNADAGGRPDGMLAVQVPGDENLVYELIVGDDVRDVVRRLVKRLGTPERKPPYDFLRLPVYSTWVEHKTAVSQEQATGYAQAIADHRLPCGVIEIDDRWESAYGGLEFDPVKFPDPKAMVDRLHNLGFCATLWVHPYANTDSRTYAAHRRDGFLLRDRTGEAGLVRWWNGVAAVWDHSNPEAAAEFRARLTSLQERYGFDGFKFDGGDIQLLPEDMVPAGDMTAAEFADVYNREAAARFEWSESRVGVDSQPLGIVLRLADKHSRWGKNNGLGALIPEALTASLRGFPFVMPDMVGGNEYEEERIDKELLVRFAQACALMPLLQFSRGPWHFDEETVRLCREASELHVRAAPLIDQLAGNACSSGEPIIAPLWYHSPTDPETHQIMDQFMLGGDVVVAPVLAEGAIARDLYLPEGSFRDLKTGAAFAGRRWLRRHPAPLDTLPVFVREGASVLHLLGPHLL